MIDDLNYDIRRSDWLKPGVPWKGTGASFSDTYLKYINIHWPGREGFFPKDVIASLNSTQISYLNRKPTGYDLGYSAGVDLSGLIYQIRGLDYRAASNGDKDYQDDVIPGNPKLLDNLEVFSIYLAYGRADTISNAMIAGVQRLVRQLLKKWPHLIINGHRDMDYTECPGPQAYDLIKQGAFYPDPQETYEADMIYLPDSYRIYDSRTKAQLTPNKLTSLDLDFSQIPSNIRNAVKNARRLEVNVTAFGIDQHNPVGWLSLYGNSNTSTHNWSRNYEPCANALTIPLWAGKARAYCIREAHVIIDVVGYAA